jgi:peroxiredoxin
MESFNLKLTQIEFKTFYRNQIHTFDYDNLFANRRILIASLNNLYTTCTGLYIKSFENCYDELISLGLDDVCLVDSSDWLVGPMMDKKKTEIKGLPDRNLQFVSAVADHASNSNNIVDLARHWQYMMIINNGQPEKLWTSPYKNGLTLTLLKNRSLRYRGLGPDVVKKYLVDISK